MSDALKKADDLYRKSLHAVGDDLQTIRGGFKKDDARYIINIGQAIELDHKYYEVDKYAPLLWGEPFNFPKIGGKRKQSPYDIHDRFIVEGCFSSLSEKKKSNSSFSILKLNLQKKVLFFFCEY